MKIAVFPGSFDPITNAHVDIVERATALFDKIYIAVGTNSTKKGFFSTDERLAIIQSVCAPYQGAVEAVQFKRSEEHTSELQSLMRISYAVLCLTKKKLQHIQFTMINTNQ